MAKLDAIVKWLDDQLAVQSIADVSLNGLQVASDGPIKKIGVAVDAAAETFQAAIDAHVDLLIVHHGLFWGQSERLIGSHYRRIKQLMDHQLALYAAHLPLDLHPKWGNNIIMAKKLDLKAIESFGEYHGIKIGYGGSCEKALELTELAKRLEKITSHPVKTLSFGKAKAKRMAIISGGGGSLFKQAADQGYDTYITGEFLHQDVQSAKECGLNIMVAGHYASETLGVQALGQALSTRFSLPTQFLDCPTGF